MGSAGKPKARRLPGAGPQDRPNGAGRGELIFKLRGVLPVPALLVMLVWSAPTSGSLLRGGLIVLVGESIRVWAAGHIQAYRVYEVEAERLATTGPYAHVRNPLYWGNFLIGLGFSAAANWWPAYVLFAAVYACIYSVIIPLEERYLRERFGREYEEYAAHVRRLLPRLLPYRRNGGRINMWVALKSEAVTIGVHLLVTALFAAKLFV